MRWYRCSFIIRSLSRSLNTRQRDTDLKGQIRYHSFFTKTLIYSFSCMNIVHMKTRNYQYMAAKMVMEMRSEIILPVVTLRFAKMAFRSVRVSRFPWNHSRSVVVLRDVRILQQEVRSLRIRVLVLTAWKVEGSESARVWGRQGLSSVSL